MTELNWWVSGKQSACQWERDGFSPWVGKTPWRRKWQSTTVFLLAKPHGQRNLAGYSPWGCKRVRRDIVTKNNSTFHFFLQSFAETWLTNHKAVSVLLNKCSVHFSRSVVSDSLWSHEPQHTRPPCPSLLLESTQTHVHWVGEYHPTISASVVPFSCNQSFPASGSFPMSQLFMSGGQSIEASASASVLSMNI